MCNTGKVPCPVFLSIIIPVTIFLLLFAGLTGPVHAAPEGSQQLGSWLKTYPGCGNCEGRAVAITPDGGYIVTGKNMNSAGQDTLLVLRTDSAGTVQWQVTAGDPACNGTALVSIPPSRTAVLGSCPDSTGDAFLTILEDTDGRVHSTRRYDINRRTVATAMTAVAGGGFFLAEEADTAVIGKNGREVVFRRIDSEGKSLWARTYAGTFSAVPAAVATGNDGSVAVAGSANGPGVTGTDILLLLLDPAGNEVGRRTFGTDGYDMATGIVPDNSGGYLIAGSSCTGADSGTCQISAVRTAMDGTPVWQQRYTGTGRDITAAIVAASDGGYTIIGITRTPDPAAQDRDILILHIDSMGKELWRRTIGTAADEMAEDAVLAAGGSLVITGSSIDSVGMPTLFLISIGNGGVDPPTGLLKEKLSPNSAGSLSVLVRDAVSGVEIHGAGIYYDGEFVGSTSAVDGMFSLDGRTTLPRSVRVTMEGYRETTLPVADSTAPVLAVYLQPSPIHRLLGAGSPEQSFDIVFVPSNTSYDCTLQQKTVTDQYAGNKDIFVNDIRQLTGRTLLQVPAFSAFPAQIPQDYTRNMNIYYYWDGNSFADAFDGCAGKLPGRFWDDAPYTDVAVIVYPSYGGRYSGSPCEPQGCTNGNGPGLQSWMKVPADKSMLFMHESGHSLFGLMDTYCGETFYSENLPYPNIWVSETNCMAEASRNGRNISFCRPVSDGQAGFVVGCGNGFWKYDPFPDLMGNTGEGASFGEASTRRIRYVFEAITGGGIP